MCVKSGAISQLLFIYHFPNYRLRVKLKITYCAGIPLLSGSGFFNIVYTSFLYNIELTMDLDRQKD